MQGEAIVLRPKKVIEASQAWFWDPRWQEGEREASRDIGEGRSRRFESDKEFLESLDRTVPTYKRTERFDRDWAGLMDDQRRRFRVAVRRFLADLPSGRFGAGLRVRGVERAEGVFQYGPGQGSGPHVIWRRIGTHDIFDRP